MDNFYGGAGRKCPFCSCQWSSAHDYNLHARVCEGKNGKWFESSFDDSEWCRVSSAPKDLLRAVRQNDGKILLNGYEIWLERSGKYLKRRTKTQI